MRKQSIIGACLSLLVCMLLVLFVSYVAVYGFGMHDSWLGKDITYGAIVSVLIVLSPVYLLLSYFGFLTSKIGNQNAYLVGAICGALNAVWFHVITYICSLAIFRDIDSRLILIGAITATSYFFPKFTNARYAKSKTS